MFVYTFSIEKSLNSCCFDKKKYDSGYCFNARVVFIHFSCLPDVSFVFYEMMFTTKQTTALK